MLSAIAKRGATIARRGVSKNFPSITGSDSVHAFSVRFNSSSSKDEVPDNYFNEKLESEKEWLDIASSLMTGGFSNLTDVKLKKITWEELDKARDELDPQVLPDKLSPEVMAELERAVQDESLSNSPMVQMILETAENAKAGAHLDDLQQPMILPIHNINYTLPVQDTVAYSEPSLDKFVSPKDDDMYRTYQEGYQHCPGKRQRNGKSGVLRCHKIDLDKLDYLDLLTLRTYLSDDAEILGRKQTGLCAKCQRQVAKTIKRARNFGILPHLGEFEIQEVRPTHQGSFHDPVKVDKVKVSKTAM